MTDPSRDDGKPRPGEVALSWWRALQGRDESHPRPDRASLARLRRCRQPLDVIDVAAYYGLLRRHGVAASGREADRLAVVAAVLAHVREHRGDKKVARQIGPTAAEADDGVMSEARFRRLLRVQGDDELLRAMVRLVKMLKGEVNVADLADGILRWNESTRRRWAFAYFDAEGAAPAGAARPQSTSPN